MLWSRPRGQTRQSRVQNEWSFQWITIRCCVMKQPLHSSFSEQFLWIPPGVTRGIFCQSRADAFCLAFFLYWGDMRVKGKPWSQKPGMTWTLAQTISDANTHTGSGDSGKMHPTMVSHAFGPISPHPMLPLDENLFHGMLFWVWHTACFPFTRIRAPSVLISTSAWITRVVQCVTKHTETTGGLHSFAREAESETCLLPRASNTNRIYFGVVLQLQYKRQIGNRLTMLNMYKYIDRGDKPKSNIF